jgi:hypothetical protein
VRLQTLVLSLNKDKIEITNSILASQNSLKILTGINEEIIPEWSVSEAKISRKCSAYFVRRFTKKAKKIMQIINLH